MSTQKKIKRKTKKSRSKFSESDGSRRSSLEPDTSDTPNTPSSSSSHPLADMPVSPSDDPVAKEWDTSFEKEVRLVRHDILDEMNSLYGFLQILEMTYENDPSIKTCLGQAEKIMKLTRRLRR